MSVTVTESPRVMVGGACAPHTSTHGLPMATGRPCTRRGKVWPVRETRGHASSNAWGPGLRRGPTRSSMRRRQDRGCTANGAAHGDRRTIASTPRRRQPDAAQGWCPPRRRPLSTNARKMAKEVRAGMGALASRATAPVGNASCARLARHQPGAGAGLVGGGAPAAPHPQGAPRWGASRPQNHPTGSAPAGQRSRRTTSGRRHPVGKAHRQAVRGEPPGPSAMHRGPNGIAAVAARGKSQGGRGLHCRRAWARASPRRRSGWNRGSSAAIAGGAARAHVSTPRPAS
jgi:hypothetical protein